MRKAHNSKLKTHNSKCAKRTIQNSKLKMRKAHNSKLKTQNAQSAQFKTQNSKLKTHKWTIQNSERAWKTLPHIIKV